MATPDTSIFQISVAFSTLSNYSG